MVAWISEACNYSHAGRLGGGGIGRVHGPYVAQELHANCSTQFLKVVGLTRFIHCVKFLQLLIMKKNR